MIWLSGETVPAIVPILLPFTAQLPSQHTLGPRANDTHSLSLSLSLFFTHRHALRHTHTQASFTNELSLQHIYIFLN